MMTGRSVQAPVCVGSTWIRKKEKQPQTHKEPLPCMTVS